MVQRNLPLKEGEWINVSKGRRNEMTTVKTISEDKQEMTLVHYEHNFRCTSTDFQGGGYSFPCSPDGVLDEDRHNENLSLVKADPSYVDEGICFWTERVWLCSCGSGEIPQIECDARGIYLGKMCYKCRDERLSIYRPDVLTDTNYWHDEPIEEEE